MKKFKNLMLLLFVSVTIMIFFAKCSKEEYKPDCEKYNQGDLEIVNDTEDTYNCYIDGVFVVELASNRNFKKEKLNASLHTYKFTQKDGYILYPTIYEGDVFVLQCETKQLIME